MSKKNRPPKGLIELIARQWLQDVIAEMNRENQQLGGVTNAS